MSQPPIPLLGKQAPRHDARTLDLARYFTPSLPPPPASIAWGRSVARWGMMQNDALGDCTCAAAGHLVMAWASENKKLVVPADAQIVAAYSAITGYAPSDPTSDRGAVELDVLKFWRASGIAGHKIGAFASVSPKNVGHVKSAIALFGGLYIGVALPLSAQGQAVWDVPKGGARGKGKPGSWGGHAVPVIGYDASGLTVVTWGQPLKMTWAFWAAYCDEAYALLSPDWVDGTAPAPSGFDLATLTADLKAL